MLPPSIQIELSGDEYMTPSILHRAFVIVFLIIGLACLANFTPHALATEFHDVKYFFDNTENFRESLPRSWIIEKVIVRGRVVTFMDLVVCIKGPCPPKKSFGLQDVNNENYKIHIYETNPLLQRLKVGKVYILSGSLEKSVDVGRKIVFISNFKPEAIIRNEANIK